MSKAADFYLILYASDVGPAFFLFDVLASPYSLYLATSFRIQNGLFRE